jgi:hypothetical protein
LTHPRIQGLPALVNGTKVLPPTSSDLRAGLIDEPIDPGLVPTRPRRRAEGGESLHPPRDAPVINIETAFGQDLLTVTAANPYRSYDRKLPHFLHLPASQPSKLRRWVVTAGCDTLRRRRPGAPVAHGTAFGARPFGRHVQ